MILQEFIDNNYNIDDFKQYSDFLTECLNKDYNNCPTHKHHILPKSMNGSNVSYNLIVLNYEDHFIAHLILANCFESGTPEYKSNLYACKLITSYIKKYMNIKNYEVPEKYSEFWSLSDTLFKDFGKGRNNYFYGKTHSEETIKIIKEKRAKQVFNVESKQKMANHLLTLPNTQKGKLNPNYGKTFEEIHGIDKAAKIKQKLKDKRANYVRNIPNGIFKCDIVIDGIHKSYYRFCPNCNDIIYYNGKRASGWQTITTAHKNNVICMNCRVKRRYSILKIN